MKHEIGSVIISLIGICFVVWFNYQFSQDYLEFAAKFDSENSVVPSVIMNNWVNKSIAIGILLIGAFLGIKSYRNNKKVGILSVTLSIFLFILVFFPLWPFMI